MTQSPPNRPSPGPPGTASGRAAPERDYTHRDVLDKLGVKAGQAVAFDETACPLDPALRDRLLARIERPAANATEPLDLVLATVDTSTAVVAVLLAWKARLQPAGGIWLLSPKRQQPGYVDQRQLITAALEAGLVDNKSCSVSDTLSGLRCVIRLRDRGVRPPTW